MLTMIPYLSYAVCQKSRNPNGAYYCVHSNRITHTVKWSIGVWGGVRFGDDTERSVPALSNTAYVLTLVLPYYSLTNSTYVKNCLNLTLYNV